jgi:putative hemolysin
VGWREKTKEDGMLGRRFGATLLFATLLAAMLSGCGSTQNDISSPAAYCRSFGGTVQARIPEYGTNNPNPLKLAGTQDFCKFTAPDNTAIFISTDTLYADKPTLAALAYYAQTPAQAAPNGENPASVYCTLLGGSDLFGGKNAAGGGWVDTSDQAFKTVEACVFPDLSIIDSFGLFYHSNGTIRGIDLSTVLRYEAPPR